MVLEAVRRTDPVLVGFSLIFRVLHPTLRRADQTCCARRASTAISPWAATVPSLSYEQTLTTPAELDSVVRYEGEATLLEMVEARMRRPGLARRPRRRAAVGWRDRRQPGPSGG